MFDFPSFEPTVKATFLSRPNRFIAIGKLPDQSEVRIHMPNPGRLCELLLPGTILYIQDHGDTQRKTRYSCIAVERDGEPVFLHTTRNNEVAHFLIDHKKIPSLKNARVMRKEITVDKSRFDFLLKNEGMETLMEVKSVTLFGRGVGMFPDAVTERGRKHLLELAALSSENNRPIVLFLIHHSNLNVFAPDYHTDLEFSRTLFDVKDRLNIIPLSIGWTSKLRLKKEVHELEIPWDLIRREMGDGGGFVAILRSGTTFYLYTETVQGVLEQRISQFKRKSSGRRLELGSSELVDLFPIRQSVPNLCPITSEFALEYEPTEHHKKEKCECVSHLFRVEHNPLHQVVFHNLIEKYRMAPLEKNALRIFPD
jgi:sugar fermentation stimulation protein A